MVCTPAGTGEVAEWSNAAVLKTVRANCPRGFESLPLRQQANIVNNDLIKLGIWIVIIGGTFGYLWYKGHLLKLSTYVKETREELRKCSWPSLEELKGSTVVVMISIALLGLLTVGADLVILKLVRGILPKI